MDPATLAAVQLGRAVAPYVWRAVTVAAAVGGCLALVLLLTLAGGIAQSTVEDEGQPSRCGGSGSTLFAVGSTASVAADGVALDADQLANASVIAATGRQLGIPERGIVAALATAAQESQLRNLDHGNADSVGVFQQRPSQGWGQVIDLMRPDYAATRFFQALQRVAGWERLPVAEAAQAVQRSAFPSAYAKWETMATALAGLPSVRGAVCAAVQAAGTLFSDATGLVSGLPRGNPRSVEEAIRWARGQAASRSGGWYRRCLAFVAQAYGWGFSGTPYAIDQYTVVMPTALRHDGDRNPPAGALLFWSTGSRAGHVALYVGGGMVASNDIEVDGQIAIVPADVIETRWGATYVGWSPPYFPGGG